jgi:hypothetical protein
MRPPQCILTPPLSAKSRYNLTYKLTVFHIEKSFSYTKINYVNVLLANANIQTKIMTKKM